MAIELQTFASGDTDYIAKLNSNVAALEDAINALQLQLGSVAGAVSVGSLMDSLFNRADALIGPNSYAPTLSGSTLTVEAGGMYLAASQKVVSLFSAIAMSFVGQSAGTYYIVVDSSGFANRASVLQPGGNIYSVYWNGSAFGAVDYLVKVFYDTNESDASRKSATMGELSSPPEEAVFLTLDERLEAGETLAKEAISTAKYRIRKVGITVDGTIGVKGAIQIDFEGTIIGWSLIATTPGNIQVEVSRKSSLFPPAAPAIPNPTTDKISASAPIALASPAQSASGGVDAVSTWVRDLERFDVVQFAVASASLLTKATLYLRIQELVPTVNPPELPLPSPLEDL